LPSAVADSLLQDNKNLGNFELSHSHISTSNFGASSQSSTSGLNTGPSSSESNLLNVILAEIKLFLKQKF
jgi:hypothetical protein